MCGKLADVLAHAGIGHGNDLGQPILWPWAFIEWLVCCPHVKPTRPLYPPMSVQDSQSLLKAEADRQFGFDGFMILLATFLGIFSVGAIAYGFSKLSAFFRRLHGFQHHHCGTSACKFPLINP